MRVTACSRNFTVSIHASSREDATLYDLTGYFLLGVSIHASSREDATQYPVPDAEFILFQSTRPRGRTRLSDPYSPQ